MPFTAMLKRDEHGIPVDQLQSFDIASRGTFDDCFIPDGGPIVLHYSDFNLELNSDCSHWVIFDQQRQTMCVEPQSGPPNGINDSPELLQTDDQLSRWFEIRWTQ
jgi:aldose 1-epimerase